MSGLQSISVSSAQNFASVAASGQPSLQPFANLNLSEAQRTQMRQIFTSAKQNGTSKDDVQKQLDAVLTPAQQQTLKADLKTARAGHHHAGGDQAEQQPQQQPSSTSASATPAATSTSTDSTILDLVTNIQNQAAAAQSTVLDTLQQQVLATNTAQTNGDTTNDNTPNQ